jgi:hypothetical protein
MLIFEIEIITKNFKKLNMKKLIQSFTIVFFSTVFLIGCSSKTPKTPEDIKISQLETACDHADAMVKCAEALDKLKGSKYNFGGGKLFRFRDIASIPDENQERAKLLVQKINDIRYSASHNTFNPKSIMSCPSMQVLCQYRLNYRCPD